jgi:hypothetical protein
MLPDVIGQHGELVVGALDRSVKMFWYMGPAVPEPCQLAVSFLKPSGLSWKMRIARRLATMMGSGTRVMYTGSSSYSKAMTTHMSMPSSLMMAGRMLSSLHSRISL